LKTRHISLIGRYSTKYSIRGGVGLVFLLLSLIFGLTVANALIQPVEAMVVLEKSRGVELSPEEAATRIKDADTMTGGMVRSAIGWVLGSGKVQRIEDPDQRAEAEAALETWTDHLLDDHPALLSAILMILLWGWPFVTILGAFNLFSGDIQSRGLRYHLMRADRSSIFLGRVAGMAVSQSVVLLVLVLTIVLYMGGKLPFYGWGALLTWGLQGCVMLIVLSLPYIALSAWISAAIDSPVVSLTAVSMVVGGVPLMALLGRNQWEPMENILYLLPWGTQVHLQHYSLANVLGAMAACLAYAALFLYLGHRHFTKRDL
jgi:ABC-type transport system involved in multi-copper enzyme maturation permease subunit